VDQQISLGFAQLGGFRPTAAYYWGRAAVAAGMYGRYQELDWPRVQRLVFVCSGNVCRSPYGSGRARLLGIPALSCGISATDGAGADPTAVRMAAERNVALGAHRSVNLTSLDLSSRDLLLAAEPVHARAAEALSVRANAQVTLLGLWSNPPSAVIPDPYGMQDTCFELVFNLIDQAIQTVANRMPTGH
jgi:protein-tyrosine phosphatase